MAKQKKDKPLITRGYKELTKVLLKKSKYIKHCHSCHYFYQAQGDDEELCQNENVLEYDVVIDGLTVFCHYWKPCEPLTEETEEEDDYLARFKKKLKSKGI